MPVTIILNQNCIIPLTNQREEMITIAKSIGFTKISCYDSIHESYEVLDSDSIAILVLNLDSISSFYHDYKGFKKTSYIIPSPNSRFISIKDDIDVRLSDFSVIEALEAIREKFEILNSFKY